MEFRSFLDEEERIHLMNIKKEVEEQINYDKDMVIILMKSMLERVLIDRSLAETLTNQDIKETDKINVILNDLKLTEIFPYF